MIGHAVERAAPVARAVVAAAERSADDPHALGGEPVDERVVVALGRGAPDVDLRVGRHVLHDLDDRRTVVLATAVDPVEELARAVGTLRDAACRDVGDRRRSHLAEVPEGRDVEEVDDADLDTGARERRRLPVVGVGDADLRSRRGSEGLRVLLFGPHVEVDRPTDPSAELTAELADRDGRHPRQHHPARRRVDHCSAGGLDGTARRGAVVIRRVDDLDGHVFDESLEMPDVGLDGGKLDPCERIVDRFGSGGA